MKRPAALTAATLTVTLFPGSTGCVASGENGNPEGRLEAKPAAVPGLAKQVPADLRKREVLRIGTNPTFAPAELKDSIGSIIGFNIDFMRAMTSVLDSRLGIQEQDFALILPALSAGIIDVGASGFTPGEEHRKIYDPTDYLGTGLQWVHRPSNDASSDSYYGKTVVVQRNAAVDMKDPSIKNQGCLDHGLPSTSKLAYQDAGTTAITAVLRCADALVADSLVSAYAVNCSEGRLELTGDIHDSVPLGFAIPEDSELGPIL